MSHPRKSEKANSVYHGDRLDKRTSPKERSQANKSERSDRGSRK
jgi:hypothetical protein